MNRRAFLSWVGVGGLASSLPVALAACSATTETKTQPPSGFQSVGRVADLNQNGQLLNKDSVFGPVLVVRNTETNIVAVNPTCTHKGCLVDWKADQKLFVCPCHNSEFTIDGRVQKEPANQPLKVYQAKTEGDSVLVSS